MKKTYILFRYVISSVINPMEKADMLAERSDIGLCVIYHSYLE